MCFLFSIAMAAMSCTVTAPVAGMHSEPSVGAALVSQAIFSTNIKILADRGQWLEVETPDGYSGWMESASVIRLDRPYATEGRIAHIESLFANLYREPDVTSHSPLLTLPYGARLEVTGEPEAEDRRWIEIRLPDRRAAWIQRGDARFNNDALSIGETIALARRFAGLPYLWGGTSTFGFDCSGFTQMLCRRRGVTIPRDAEPQARWDGVETIERAELRAGDLVYFSETGGKITHTGLYIGDGEFIHATAWKKPRVQISQLAEPHWSERLVACRRLRGESR